MVRTFLVGCTLMIDKIYEGSRKGRIGRVRQKPGGKKATEPKPNRPASRRT